MTGYQDDSLSNGHQGTSILTKINKPSIGTRAWTSNYIHVKSGRQLLIHSLTTAAIGIREWMSNYTHMSDYDMITNENPNPS